MVKFKSTLILWLLCIIETINPLNAQVRIDTTAISVFWEVADTLSQDKSPSDHLWEKFSHHPAYAQIEKSGNRVTILKRVMPVVFKPSYSNNLDQVLSDTESMTKYFAEHLQEIKMRRKELNKYLKSGEVFKYKTAYTKSLDYLPDDIDSESINLTVYVALFEKNGFGGNVITVDLLHLLNSTEDENFGFLGHEFHHALRLNTKKYEQAELSHPVIQALSKMPLEGVACLINRSEYFNEDYLANSQNFKKEHLESITEFRYLVSKAPDHLKEIEAVLISKLSDTEKSKKIQQNMPWGGHTVGFYMARAIEQQKGKDVLIKVQYSPIKFIRSYQQVALNSSELFRFSNVAMNFLLNLEKQ